MNFSDQTLCIDKARQIHIVAYLSNLGHEPAKIRGVDYWYLSPLGEEKTHSFKINRKVNRWYDHGLGKGDYTIDFSTLYNNCKVGEFLFQLSGNHSFQKSLVKQSHEQAESDVESKI